MCSSRNHHRLCDASPQPQLGVGPIHRRGEEGCDRIDRQPGRHGRGCLATRRWSLYCCAERLGWEHGTDLYTLDGMPRTTIVRPAAGPRPVRVSPPKPWAGLCVCIQVFWSLRSEPRTNMAKPWICLVELWVSAACRWARRHDLRRGAGLVRPQGAIPHGQNNNVL